MQQERRSIGNALALGIVLSLILGYWDMRLSDHFLYMSQMAKVHYWRTLEAHMVLGVLLGIALIPFRQRFALAVTLLTFFIIGIKVHLIWLDTHFTDPQGLLWTFVLALCCAGLY